jgi:hypothetical protein
MPFVSVFPSGNAFLFFTFFCGCVGGASLLPLCLALFTVDLRANRGAL